MYPLDFRIVIIKNGEIVEAITSKIILIMPKNQGLSKFQRIRLQESSLKELRFKIYPLNLMDSCLFLMGILSFGLSGLTLLLDSKLARGLRWVGVILVVFREVWGVGKASSSSGWR